MKSMRAIIVSLCVLAVLPAILIPVLLLPRRAPYKAVVIPLKKMPALSPVPG